MTTFYPLRFGWGATSHSDGADVGDGYVGNCSSVPVESLEQNYPFMRIEEYRIRRKSGGAGKHRGGMGARRVYRVLEDDVNFNCYSDRHRIEPWGLFGGENGEPTRFIVERDGEEITLGSKVNFTLQEGDRLILETAGAGGYGNPTERDREAVRKDIEAGFVSEESAYHTYGFDESMEKQNEQTD